MPWRTISKLSRLLSSRLIMTGRKSLCSKHWPLCAQEDEVSGTTAALQASGFRKHWARVHVCTFEPSVNPVLKRRAGFRGIILADARLGIGVRIRANREGGNASWARALLPEAEVPSAMGAVIALRFGFQDAPLKFCRLRSFSSRGKGFLIPSRSTAKPWRSDGGS